MRKILITGGAGFIGYHLAKELLKDDYEVTLIDDFSRGVMDDSLAELKKSKQVTFRQMNLLDNAALGQLETDYDYIYHLAAIIGVKNVLDHAFDVLDRNVQMLIKMIYFAKKQKSLKRFIFASTSEIYAGTLQYYEMEIPTPENTPLTITDMDKPRTSYMLSKIYGEALVRQSGLPYTIIRPHNFYGPRMGMAHVIPELLKKADSLQEGSKLDVFSSNHTRTFIYIEDAVRMVKILAESDKSLNNFYNVGNQTPEVNMGYLAECIINIVGKKLEINPLPPTEGSPERRCPNTEKLFEATKYRSGVNLEDGIKRTYEWYKENIFSGKTRGAV